MRLLPAELQRESGLTSDEFDQATKSGFAGTRTRLQPHHDLETARGLVALRDCGLPIRNARPVVLAGCTRNWISTAPYSDNPSPYRRVPG